MTFAAGKNNKGDPARIRVARVGDTAAREREASGINAPSRWAPSRGSRSRSGSAFTAR
jgi:hypothetical protein